MSAPKRLLIVHHTQSGNTGRLAAAARAEGVELAGVVTGPLDPTAVPDALAGADAVPLFYKTGLARLAGFPTRMAEALGCGVPVVVNGDSGEVAAIVAEHPGEFFAVVSEVFFEAPLVLQARFPAVYDQLVRFYGLDPAARAGSKAGA